MVPEEIEQQILLQKRTVKSDGAVFFVGVHREELA